ncbi:MAG: 50S ribosomal protein L11 methyltransferase [Pseudomonadota bacterium]
MVVISTEVTTAHAERLAELIQAEAVTLLPAGSRTRIEWLVAGDPRAWRMQVTTLLERIGESCPPLSQHTVPGVGWVEKVAADTAPVCLPPWLIIQDHHDRRAGAGVLQIIAGQAFGTGHHPTTAGCLTALTWLARRAPAPRLVYDLGCGSGILALAAGRLWPYAAVLASDDDPLAVMAARAHAKRNGHKRGARKVRGRLWVGRADGPCRAARRVDILMANILSGPLLDMAPGIVHVVRPGGHVILAGMLIHQGGGIIARYRGLGMRVRRRLERDGWLTLVLVRR